MKAFARISLTVAVVLGALGACHPAPPASPTPRPGPAANPELSPTLTPLAWWPGVWNAPDGVEQWVAAGGTLYGVTLRDDRMFEVMIVDAAEDGSLRFTALPNGLPGVELRERTRASTNTMQTMVFASDEHGSIGFTRTGAGLAVRLAIPGAPPITTSSLPGAVRPSVELERADRAFAADTAKRGVDGWVAAFAPTGAMLRATGRIAMAEPGAIGAAMRELLEGGVLAWAPIASRVHGDLGFTIGKATYVRHGETRVDWRSSYATIWQRQPDQTWQVLFDVGRLINER